ncbi:MAG: hypothetical protein RIR10_1922 [Planctomycetota bacterium]
MQPMKTAFESVRSTFAEQTGVFLHSDGLTRISPLSDAANQDSESASPNP